MKITPIEIRQHTFQRVLRGYDAEEVTAFLTSLSNEWERVLNDNKMLKMQLEIAEKELNKLRDVELTMFRMMKSAEETSVQMTDQAKIAAEQYINDARQKGEEMMDDARKRGNMLVIDSENQAKYVREEVLGEFKTHERDFKAMEKYRDNLIVQLKTLANNTSDSIERFEKKFSQASVKEKIEDLRGQVNQSLKTNEVTQQARVTAEQETNETAEIVAVAPEEDEPELVTLAEVMDKNAEVEKPEEAVAEVETAAIAETQESPEAATSPENEEAEKPKEGGSFFDQI